MTSSPSTLPQPSHEGDEGQECRMFRPPGPKKAPSRVSDAEQHGTSIMTRPVMMHSRGVLQSPEWCLSSREGYFVTLLSICAINHSDRYLIPPWNSNNRIIPCGLILIINSMGRLPSELISQGLGLSHGSIPKSQIQKDYTITQCISLLY